MDMNMDKEEKSTDYYNNLAMKAVHSTVAFNELYDYFFPRVYNFLFARIKNVTATDDVISDIFMKVFKNLYVYDSKKAAFSTWLFRIAINQTNDYFRMQQRCKESTWEEFFDPAVPQYEEPEAKLLATEGKKELLKALEVLKERDRQILELKYWSDLSNKEIAVIMDLSPANVGIILFRAMGILKKVMS